MQTIKTLGLMPGVPTGSLLGTVNGNRPTGEIRTSVACGPFSGCIHDFSRAPYPMADTIQHRDGCPQTCVGVVALLSKLYSGRKNGARTVQRGPTRSQVLNIDMPSFHAIHAGRPVIRVIYRFAHL